MKKLLSFIAAAAMAATIVPAAVVQAAGVGDVATLQAEDLTAFKGYNASGQVTGTRDSGADTFNGGKYLAEDLLGSIDSFPNFVDGNGGPEQGETGNGILIASYNRHVYSIYMRRENHASGNKSIYEMTYDLKAPATGKYSVNVYGYVPWAGNPVYLNVNGTSVTLNNVHAYGNNVRTADWTLTENVASVNLNKGSNTVIVSLGNTQCFNFDKIEFVCTEAEAEPDPTAPIKVEAESFTALKGVNGSGADVSAARDSGANPTFGGAWLQSLMGSVHAFPWYYSSPAPTRNESGDGLKIASWGTMTYSVRLSSAEDANNGRITELTYNVTALEAGSYYVSFASWTDNGGVKVNVNGKNAAITKATGGIGDSGWITDADAARINLDAGANTITLTIDGANKMAVLDYFTLEYAGAAAVPAEVSSVTRDAAVYEGDYNDIAFAYNFTVTPNDDTEISAVKVSVTNGVDVNGSTSKTFTTPKVSGETLLSFGIIASHVLADGETADNVVPPEFKAEIVE